MKARDPIGLALILFVAVLLASVLWGCAPAPCVRPVVHLDRPTLPTIPAADLQCLSDVTYRALVARDLAHREWADECEVIVRSLTETP